MGSPKSESVEAVLDQILGYLNFSSGNHDPAFYSNLNLAYGNLDLSRPRSAPRDQLLQRLSELQQLNPAFGNADQARTVIELTFDQLFPAYRRFHGDLLFHQTDELLFNSFFAGRCMESLLAQLATRHEPHSAERLVETTIYSLDDFIGHRPIASLESQKIEPYLHERVAPVPLYIRGAGVAVGKYSEILEIAIGILRQTPDDVLRSAQFNPERMTELCLDPRAFDFDHPNNRRPNYHFGQWDEDHVNNEGFFTRFILQQVTLDSLLERGRSEQFDNEGRPIAAEQLMFEAGAALAGTMLMASGISGRGPGAHDSNTTLGKLIPVIAQYRDHFYYSLVERLPDPHRQRLVEEAASRHQPFGAVRQDLNARLAEKRAKQLVNCRLAKVYAQMGYPDAAEKQSEVVPVASARIQCQIDCLLSTANFNLDHAKTGVETGKSETEIDDSLSRTLQSVRKIMTLLHRGIECGAIVDPWNIIGFDAHFSLFPAMENSVQDHRAFDLVELVERILALCSKLWSEAAAHDRLQICQQVQGEFREITDWWRQFAAHEVMAVDAVDPEDIYDAAFLVAQALNLWHKGGAAAGDIQFWAEHAQLFDSPKAYTLVIDALLERGDYQTASALLVHWLGQAGRIPLQQGDSSFHDLMFRWISAQKNLLREEAEVLAPEARVLPEKIWTRIRKFYDFVEANAEHYWEVPLFQLGRRPAPADETDPDHPGGEEDPDGDIYRAAYEEMTYADTTADGFEGNVFDTSLSSDDALEAEADRVLDRLEFLGTVASYWRIAASIPLPGSSNQPLSEKVQDRLRHRRDIVRAWVSQAVQNRKRLIDLLESVHQFPLPSTGTDHDSMIEYDRNRLYKESLLDQTIKTCVATENAIRMLLAVIRAVNHLIDGAALEQAEPVENGGSQLVTVFAAIILRDPERVTHNFPDLVQFLRSQPLLYVPLSKGGDPTLIVAARVTQSALNELLGSLPSLGLFNLTHQLTGAALDMERNHPIGAGAVTEFDRIFEISYTSMVRCLVQTTDRMYQDMIQDSNNTPQQIKIDCENVLFDCIELLTESMLLLWLDHSNTLRLTVLEKVFDDNSWNRIVEFIRHYGDNLFTQQFLQLGNVRAILHQGVDQWLHSAQEAPNRSDSRLLDELDQHLPRQKASRYLTLVLEAIIENYDEYRDYNTTTTQSDDGTQLYILLDFLRLQGRYERVCWKLKPVVWAHEILVRDQQNGVARMWRRSLTERVGPEADRYITMLKKLQQRYSVRMSTVERRLMERFGHPMQIDRLRALVTPAMQNPAVRKCRRTFELLQHETQAFSKSAFGAGLDLPSWLVALENEVETYLLPDRRKTHRFHLDLADSFQISIADLGQQLEQMPKRRRDRPPQKDES